MTDALLEGITQVAEYMVAGGTISLIILSGIGPDDESMRETWSERIHRWWSEWQTR